MGLTITNLYLFKCSEGPSEHINDYVIIFQSFHSKLHHPLHNIELQNNYIKVLHKPITDSLSLNSFTHFMDLCENFKSI